MKNTIMLANLIMTMVKLSRAQRRSQVYCMACQCWAADATCDGPGDCHDDDDHHSSNDRQS